MRASSSQHILRAIMYPVVTQGFLQMPARQASLLAGASSEPASPGRHIQCDNCTFAGGVAIGTDDDRSTMLFQVGKGIVSTGEGTMLRGGDMGLCHQFFGEGFAAL